MIELDALSTAALDELCSLFMAIARLEPDDRAGRAWGQWWAWQVVSEMSRRDGVPFITREPLKVGLDAIDADDLILFSTNLDRIARSNLLGLEQWCTDLVLLLCAEADRRRAEHDAECDDLSRALAMLREQRVREPYQVPDDYGLPPWSAIDGEG